MIVVFTAFVIVCVSLPELVRTNRTNAGAMPGDAGWAVILFIFQLVNAALVIWVLIRGYRLCNSIIENEYSDENNPYGRETFKDEQECNISHGDS